MTDLRDFITARLDEDWEIAFEASQDGDAGNTWSVGAHNDREARIGDDREDLAFDMKAGVSTDLASAVEHITRHHPRRVLREVAAKRRVMERHCLSTASRITAYCDWCPSGDDTGYPEVELEECPELRDLAAAWSDHADYRQEWAA